MKNFSRFKPIQSFSLARPVFLLLLMAILTTPFSSALAYQDSILDSYDKVWDAVLKVLEPHGVHKANKEKGVIESNWMEDRVERTRNVVPFNNQIQIDRTMNRRYRLTIELDEQKDGTVSISIRGKFQERGNDTHPQTPWKKVKPVAEDFDVERTFFFNILRQIEQLYR